MTGLMELWERLYLAALFRLKRKDYSIEELRRSLKRKLWKDRNTDASEVREQAIQRAIDQIVRGGFIHEERYSEQLVRSQIVRGKGLSAIQWKLRSKGLEVRKERILELIDEVAGSESGEGSLALARAVVERKYPRAHEDRKESLRAMQALLRRGFTYDIAKKAVKLCHN